MVGSLFAGLAERGVIILAIGVPLVLVLGVFGYLKVGDPLDDAIYRALGLFGANPDGNVDDMPWPLQIARFGAPALTALAAAAAVWAILNERTDRLRARLANGHVIVAGLGDRGVALVESFHEAGEELVAIETDSESAGVARVRTLGVPVVVGDARTAAVLSVAGAERADRIIAVCPTDDDNASIVAATRGLAATDADGPRIHAHLGDATLCNDLTAYSLGVGARDEGPSLFVEWFNLEQMAAKALISDHFGETASFEPEVQDAAPRGIALVGTGAGAESLVFETARQWGALVSSISVGRLPFVIVSSGAADFIERCREELDGLEKALDVRVFEDLPTVEEMADVQVSFVCTNSTAEGVKSALKLTDRLSGQEAPSRIVVRVLVEEAGIAAILQHRARRIDVVDVLSMSCSAALVKHELIEELARENHRVYLERIEGEPASRPWQDVDDIDRASNRAAARHHLTVKLPQAGYQVAPISAVGEDLAKFSPGEVERLAELEHERWTEEKRADGWTYGSDGAGAQDRPSKLHPDLVKWEKLDNNAKNKDRMFVEELPRMLAAAGYALRPPEKQ